MCLISWPHVTGHLTGFRISTDAEHNYNLMMKYDRLKSNSTVFAINFNDRPFHILRRYISPSAAHMSW